jgi:malonyl CoA-acyl carrier protein transacylase
MLALLFPGQGSQRKGMGERLFDEVREFTSVERDVDRVLGFSVRQLCLEDRLGQLNDTRYTQPSLYVVNALHYYQAVAQGSRPSFVAGHSLGEYNALLAAGAFDFLTGLRLVQKRGELMARVKQGGMAAVIGLEKPRIVDLISRDFRELDVANYNSPSQTVVSGPLDVIGRAGPAFERAGASMYIPLLVSAAFHSRYMQQAAAEFADVVHGVPFGALRIPVISNVTAEPYPQQAEPGAAQSLLSSRSRTR